MKKIKKDSKQHNIDCEADTCGNCNFKPVLNEMFCKLFDIMLDHARGGFDKDSGWKRCHECKNAEVKE